MIPVLSLLLVVFLSILVTKVATIILTQTGLSKESAKFQARSAFTGVGFTTNESEKVVNHPVRRRVLLNLMLVGNAGVITAVATLILGFMEVSEDSAFQGFIRLFLLFLGLLLLFALTQSRWLDLQFSRLVNWLLLRYTTLNVKDYANLLQLSEDYRIAEADIFENSPLANQTLQALELRKQGIVLLGIRRGTEYIGVPHGDTELKSGDHIIFYGRNERIQATQKWFRGEELTN